MYVKMAEEQEADVEQIRKKKVEAKKAEEQIKSNLRLALDEQAYDRLANVYVVNRELYFGAAQYLLRAQKQFNRKITENELVRVLSVLRAQTEKETKITFHKK